MGERLTSAKAPGKLMLLGEHAVVYGRRCIVTAVDAPVQAIISDSDRFLIDVSDLKINMEFNITEMEYPKEISFAASAVRNFYSEFGISKPVAVSTKSLITKEKKVGLGSSASVTAATMKALATHFGIKTDEKKLFELSFKTVLDVQKVGSGFDVAAAIYGKTLMYKKGIPMPLNCDELDLIIGYTGIPASTTDIVKKVAVQVKEQPGYYENIFDEIEKLVVLARNAIEAKDWATLGALMNENQELLREMQVPSEELGVSSEIIEKLVSAATDAGAYGAKLSGAGIGDCIIALASPEKRIDVEGAITAAGGTIINAKANVSGANIED